MEATAITGDDTVPFRFFYTLRQKMLIAGMQELSREEHVEEVALGSTGPLGKAQLYSVPFLNFDYAVAPRIAYGHGLYYFMQFDWYYTDATLFYMVMPEVDQGYTIHNGGESYTFRLEAVPGRGGNTAVKEMVHYIKSKGWRVGFYSNYTDLAPVNRNWDPDMMMQGPHGEWKVSWSRCYAPKPMRALEYERTYAPLIHQMFGTNHSYCDVHTAVSPMARVDYDYRVPGAATFRRTFECFGQILLNEKNAYAGPVYSEGANHWWYAGHVDGNYANARPALDKRPVFPDFQLLKLHPLEMDAGNVQATGRKYVAYTLAYGHIGICNGDEQEMMHRYYMLQPLQTHYVMIPVKEILYEKEGDYNDASQALPHRRCRRRHAHQPGCDLPQHTRDDTAPSQGQKELTNPKRRCFLIPYYPPAG